MSPAARKSTSAVNRLAAPTAKPARRGVQHLPPIPASRSSGAACCYYRDVRRAGHGRRHRDCEIRVDR